ncbi:hypothetical protein RESH_02999 [Rhodopirellula europaea SH398]|uniref:Uncharacterized protein n=2 Tax=Rhodopirellula europaea TaxID=1263866 RepID=M2A538_9BACT|nr:hypothetical protein RE6C_04166 [Rhodopirellula europaea 6C]EMI26499.1 hypothetical protein RESH_02999 [Rhodopirellula europaea SH398]
MARHAIETVSISRHKQLVDLNELTRLWLADKDRLAKQSTNNRHEKTPEFPRSKAEWTVAG